MLSKPSRSTLANLKLTALINAYSAVNIPLLAFVTPRIMELSETRSVVRIRLDRRSRNHLKVMYFGALAMGAELSIALKAIDAIDKSGKKIDFIFKDFQAEFLKRADGHVHFICDQVQGVQDLVNMAVSGSERHHRTFEGYAVVADQSGKSAAGHSESGDVQAIKVDDLTNKSPTDDMIVMKYRLTLSVKQRSKKTSSA